MVKREIKPKQAEEPKKEVLIKEEKLPDYLDRAFDLSVINTNTNYPIEKILEGVKNFGKQLKKGTNKVRSLTLLFSGNSGTGKSEFAKYLAYISGLPFEHKRASSIFDKYVGETEKIFSICLIS